MKSVKNLLAALMLLSAPVAFSYEGDTKAEGPELNFVGKLYRAWNKSIGRIPGMDLNAQYESPDKPKVNEDGSYVLNEKKDGPVIETATGVKAKFQRFAHQHPAAVNRMKVGGVAGLTAAMIGGGAYGIYKFVKSQYGKKAAAKVKALFKGEANQKAAPAARPAAVRTGWRPNRNAGASAGSCAGGRCAGGSCRR